MSQTANLSDFNDLACAFGMGAVTQQIAYAINNPVVVPAPNDVAVDVANTTGTDTPSTAAPVALPAPIAGDDYKLNDMLKRYAQITDIGKVTNKVYDLDQKVEYTKTQFANEIGNKKLADKWWAANHKKVNKQQVQKDRNELIHVAAQSMFKRYVLIYGTKEVWDAVECTRLPIETVKLARPNEFDMWLKSENRRIVKQSNLIFDPTNSRIDGDEADEVINTFGGLPIKPLDQQHTEAAQTAQPIIDLVHHLCETNPTITEWVLNWLAIPIQSPGTKLDTALIFHGEVQGAGKSLFFGRIMRELYGDYAVTLGQGQLESQYNDWVAGKLFAVFEEIFSGRDRYANMGMIKQLITGDSVYISKKFVSGWTESNYINAVFLSNNMMPLSLEKNDRRHVVCYPRAKIPQPLLKEIETALKDPNSTMIRAFYTYLKTKPLGDQKAHSNALATDSKTKLIRLSQPNWEVFHTDWRDGDVFVPYSTCLTDDLYYAYVVWCKRNGERATSKTKLMTYIGRREHKGRYHYQGKGVQVSKATIIIVNAPASFPNSVGQTQQQWLGDCIENFKQAITFGTRDNETPAPS